MCTFEGDRHCTLYNLLQYAQGWPSRRPVVCVAEGVRYKTVTLSAECTVCIQRISINSFIPIASPYATIYLSRPERMRAECVQLLRRVDTAHAIICGQCGLHMCNWRRVALIPVPPRKLIPRPVQRRLQQIHLDAPPASGSDRRWRVVKHSGCVCSAVQAHKCSCRTKRGAWHTYSHTSRDAASSSA